MDRISDLYDPRRREMELSQEDLAPIQALIAKKDWTAAGSALQQFLIHHPDDEAALFMMAHVLMETDNPPIARVLFRELANRHPKTWQHWNNLGRCCDYLHLNEESEEAFKEVLKLDPTNVMGMVGLQCSYVQQGKRSDAVWWCEKTLDVCAQELGKWRKQAVDYARRRTLTNLGFAQLSLGNYKEGWANFEYGLGKIKGRDERDYGDAPRWDGRKGIKLIVYTEQGLGDQIAGIEPLRDVMKDVEVVGINCGPRMVGLLKRNFPSVVVHGHPDDFCESHPEIKIDYKSILFSLHRFYRRGEEKYPKYPYLKVCPERELQWRSLIGALGRRPKIGLAWTGGVAITRKAARTIPPEEMGPLLSQDYDFISLEYRDRTEEIAQIEQMHGVKIHHFPWGSQSNDMDDVAALIASLDAVVAVPTTAVHLAGAIGVPTFVLLHKSPNIHYPDHGHTMPYYGCVKLIRRHSNTEWAEAIQAVVAELQEHFSERTAA